MRNGTANRLELLPPEELCVVIVPHAELMLSPRNGQRPVVGCSALEGEAVGIEGDSGRLDGVAVAHPGQRITLL